MASLVSLGMGWSRMGCDGTEWDATGWDGMRRVGMGCDRLGWDTKRWDEMISTTPLPTLAPPKPHSPDQLLVVQRPRGLPAQDVDLALEDGEAHGAHHPLLRAPDALPEEFALGAVPEACGQKGGSAGARGRSGSPGVPVQGGPPG